MNKNFKNYAYMSFAMALAMTMASCSDDDNKVEIQETDAAYVGKEVGNFSADEWYPGGELGTTDNTKFQTATQTRHQPLTTTQNSSSSSLSASRCSSASIPGTRVPSRA